MSGPVRVFISYSHKSPYWLDAFDSIMPWKNWSVEVERWWDRDIIPGSSDDTLIKEALDQMDIFVCLVTMPFLKSWYIKNVELKRAQERHAKKQIEIVPVLVTLGREKLKKLHPFLYTLQPLPSHDGTWCKYLDTFGSYSGAEEPIYEGMDKVITNMIDRKRTRRKRP